MERDPIEILVVEDREDDAIQLRRAFEESRILNRLHIVDSGTEALDFLFQRGAYEGEQAPPTPDLVILDLGLPDMEGLDVLREIRNDERFADVDFVVVTISDEDEDIIRSYDLGVQAFLQKPVRLHNVQDLFMGSAIYSFVVVRS